MQPDDKNQLYRLITQEPVAVLAVLVRDRPVTGLLPFAAAPDLQAVYVHASSLARHAAGLTKGAPFSLLIHATYGEHPDPHQVPRLSLEGQVLLLGTIDPEYQAARSIYLDKFPASEGLFSFQDFNLFRLEITGGRFVAGFARAYNISPTSLTSAISQTPD